MALGYTEPKTAPVATKTVNCHGVPRDSVPYGKLFQVVNSKGKRGKKLYANIGHNGRAFSLHLTDGGANLASTSKKDRRVEIVGDFSIDMNMKVNGTARSCRRDQVKDGEVFYVRRNDGTRGNETYVALGIGDKEGGRKYKSFNPRTRDIATIDADAARRTTVEIIGSATVTKNVKK